MAVGRGFRDDVRPHDAACAGSIVNDHLLAQCIGQSCCDDTTEAAAYGVALGIVEVELGLVAISRALLGSPGLVLMDEPSQGLAPKVVGDVMRTVRRLRESGVGVLLVEQNVNAALAVADRAVVLDHGTVAWSGTASALRDDAGLRTRLLGA